MGKESLSILFRESAVSNERVLAVFATVGFPSFQGSIEAITGAVEAGADIIELGIPFSDPVADGPVIQEASSVALQNGINIEKALEAASKIKSFADVPLMLMGYFNPFLHYGISKLFTDAYEAGVDGFIVPDLPPEEGHAFYTRANELGFATVLFLSPVTKTPRVKLINELTTGFVYFISVTGITGAKLQSSETVALMVQRFKKKVKRPLLVGFGISSPAEAAVIGKAADGVIVGTAFLKTLKDKGLKAATQFIAHLKDALKNTVTSI